MDRSIGSPQTRSVVEVRGPGVSVFGLPSEKQSVEMSVSRSKIRLEEVEEEQEDVGSRWAKLNGRTIVSYRREILSVSCYLSNYYCSRKLILSFIDQHFICLTPRCR